MIAQDLCTLLQREFGCRLLSEIGPAPADIDIFVPIEHRDAVARKVEAYGFIRCGVDHGQLDYRLYEDGKLYILDLLSEFQVYTRYITCLKLNNNGNEAIGKSPVLHKAFKYLCLNRIDKFDFVQQHITQIAAFLRETSNFEWLHPKVLNSAASGSAEALIQVFACSLLGRYTSRDFIRAKLINPILMRYKRIGRGLSIAFVGPDGSGKSFIIDKLSQAASSKQIYMGDWFFFFQKFYSFLIKIPSPYNRVVYLIYPIENYLRTLKVLFFRSIGKLVLIDRFPGTNRNVVHQGVLGKINRITFKIFPKPNLIVLLLARPEVVYARKQELTVEEIREMQNQLQLLLKDTPHLFLDTEQLDPALNQLLKFIEV
ncbi:hypothetical protein KIF53_14955 [Chromobacterium subtsugae]|uniref:Uncharacterized protein n=1 Tax=Chromobacterium subtsugae TaxID=251747 RepID=A0ABS7FFS8_9NEIS|nr:MULTISPECIES: hypothetical protein [Chromobacterium]MBW7567706.1 hypothetical protein [Chromobacterium subtsugae]MBW8288932.1 hypothetical protein [Chromobacterium subtsugae]WSE91275.1 hypothetical protein U6115_20735 [Chromobacterium subtsugae]WVH59650.1 hypothetical protein U6151_20765 [Chromobacterium subtsugae]